MSGVPSTSRGSSSSSGSAWTTSLNADPLADLNNFTSRAGTWTTFGADGVESTGGGTDDYISYNTSLAQYSLRAVQVTVKVVSSAAGTWAGCAFTKSGAYAAPDLSVGIDVGNNAVHWDLFGTGGGSLSYASFGTLALNTSYLLQVVQLDYNAHVFVYLAGNALGSFNPAAAIATGNAGLYTRSCTAWFKNVSIYGLSTPWN